MIDGGIEFHLQKDIYAFGFSSYFDQYILNSEPFQKIIHENEYELTPNEVPEIFNLIYKNHRCKNQV